MQKLCDMYIDSKSQVQKNNNIAVCIDSHTLLEFCCTMINVHILKFNDHF